MGRLIEVRQCPCSRVFVGAHGCPACKAQYLQTRLLMRVKTRGIARTIAESIRAHHGDSEVIRFYKERHGVQT